MTDIATIEIEIGRLSAEAAVVERAGPTFDERWPTVEADLLEAEATFRRVGPCLARSVPTLPELVFQRHQVAIGAAMVVDRKAVIDCERSRVKAATEGGISAADKQRRLDQLRRQIWEAAARKETLIRDEPDDFMIPRLVHPEMAIFPRAELERICSEVAAEIGPRLG